VAGRHISSLNSRGVAAVRIPTGLPARTWHGLSKPRSWSPSQHNARSSTLFRARM
jgi:hypothetical protein